MVSRNVFRGADGGQAGFLTGVTLKNPGRQRAARFQVAGACLRRGHAIATTAGPSELQPADDGAPLSAV